MGQAGLKIGGEKIHVHKNYLDLIMSLDRKEKIRKAWYYYQ